jgi:hypothetical protein
MMMTEIDLGLGEKPMVFLDVLEVADTLLAGMLDFIDRFAPKPSLSFLMNCIPFSHMNMSLVHCMGWGYLGYFGLFLH